jgi:hypothetical protein
MHLSATVERGYFLSLFSSLSYNWYWLVILVGSISVTSALAVIVPNVWVRRHHNGLRLFNEFLARHQLGICTYYASILIAVDFTSEQKILRVIVIGLVLASLAVSLLAAKWASPEHQEFLLKRGSSLSHGTAVYSRGGMQEQSQAANKMGALSQ